ncbi:(R)-specific enoyl -CoA hydratase [Haloferax larsenii JCM 13917]|nr:MaoC family dehydratase N-terminal domain-containing protein [Haloferax larsenii]ELZ82140.1 (R)-specific enoyl -CoA hydratase [Haloferax larsenii JCM 13917]
MTTNDTIREGDTRTYTRTFTNEEVQQFAELSNDTGYHHLVADEDGQVVLHGLLTATMPTKLGGDLNYLARTMEFEFPRPAYTGVEITCEATYESVEKQDDRTYLEVSFVCETEDGDVVLRGRSEGAILE